MEVLKKHLQENIDKLKSNVREKTVDDVLEVIEEVRNDDSLLGRSRQDDFDLLRMKVKELKK